MADHNQPVIIIRKKKKGGHGGHHGGAWKVAYADFVTAMMSFFLLMWLLNTTTSDQRKGIADYFAPMGISQSFGGSGGVMGGLSITAERGADISDNAPPGVSDQTFATVGQGEQGEEDVGGKSEKAADGGKGSASEPPSPPPASLTAEQLAAMDAAEFAEAKKKEEERFAKTEDLLKNAIQETPGLKDLAKHLAIDRTPEGLRIQIIDQENFSLFPSGASVPYEKARQLLRLVGAVVARLSNPISISGHTDSNPFPKGSRRDNWDLSSDRANVSRTELQLAGVPVERIARVVGLADRDPYVPGNPTDPRNRRISIVLLRQAKTRTHEAAPSPPAPTDVAPAPTTAPKT